MIRAFVAFGVSLLLWFGGVYVHFAIFDRPALTAPLQAATITYLRARLDGRDARPPDGATAGLWVTLYDHGKVAARGRGQGSSLSVALTQAVRPLLAVDAETRRRGRIKVDVEQGRAPLLTAPRSAFLFAVMPGHDGIIAADAHGEATLLPDDLLFDNLVRAHHPFAGVELDLGLDTDAVVDRLRERLASTGPSGDVRWLRLHTQGFVESAAHDGAALPVVAGLPSTPVAVTPANLRAAAARAAEYLLRHLQPDGSFDYEYDVADPATRPGDYSLPRHAGAVAFLARLYREQPSRELKDGIHRALWFLVGQARAGGSCDTPVQACVGDEDTGDLGATALALLAVAEYQADSGDATFDAWGRRLAHFLLRMQKEDGDFCHLYDIAHDRRDVETKLLYYSGEATLALARWSRVVAVGDAAQGAALTHAALRAMRHLTVDAYRPWAGAFVYGEDHWTCQAAAALAASGSSDETRGWAEFCDGFARFAGRMQVRPGDAVASAHPSFVGSYGFGPFLPPHTTPVGSRSESLLATIALEEAVAARAPDADRWRARADELRAALRDGMVFLLAHQLDADRSYLAAAPDAVAGGLQMSDAQRTIRIDTQQHCGAAFLGAADLL